MPPRKALWLAAEPPRLPLRRELSSLSAFKGLTEGEITRACCLHRGIDEHRVKSDHLLLLLPISSAFTHTRCISPSVCLLKSFMQASTFAPSPFSARASAIRSRTCGRQRLAFLAVSATGGARKPNPSEGAEKRAQCALQSTGEPRRLRRTVQIRCDTHFPHFAVEDRIRKRRFYETSCFDDT